MPIGTGRRRTRVAVLAAALLAPGLATGAEVKLQARVDQTEIAQDELVTLEVRLESPDPPSKWDIPATPDFEVVSEAPSQEQSISLGGGGGVQIRSVYGVTRQLRPTRTGSLTIPAITATVRGHQYVTQPIAVKVTAAGAVPRAPSAGTAPGGSGPGAPRGGWAYHGLEKDVSLRAEVAPREVWQGEQLTAAYWLLVPYPIEGYESATAPRLEGFWQEPMETPRAPTPSQRGGALGYLLHRVALFPTRAGVLTVDSLALRGVTIPVRGGFNPFGGYVRVDRESDPVAVKVKPLPPGAPPGFEPVNVGALSLEVKAAPERVAAGEPVTVRVTISGDGNLRALSPPRLPDVPGARAYPPSSSDRTEERGGRLVGTRTVETVLVPDRAGELIIPSVEWPYFNPRTGKYVVAVAPALRVAVTPATGVATAPRGAAPGSNVLAGALRPIRAEAALRRAGAPPWRTPAFLALLLLPPLAYAGAVVAERLRAGGDGGRASRRAGRRAQRRLSSARRRLARDPAGAMGEIERALLGYAGGRLARPAAGLTREALAAALARAGAHPPAVRSLLRALELVDVSRYGAGDALGEEVLSAAEAALEALDEADWQPVRETRS
jgi:hypothetical protein